MSMKRETRLRAATLAALFAAALKTGSAAETPAKTEDAAAWLAAVDATRNAFDEALITARATQVAGGVPQPGAADFDIYVKGRDRGLIVFRGGKNSGRKILTVGDRMWLLVPGASNPLPVTANQRLVGGASMGDVARLRFSEDFTATVRPGSETVEGKASRVLDLQAKSPKAPYPKVTLWYDAAAGLPVKVLFFLPSGKEAKEIVFESFGVAHGRTTVKSMAIHDLLARDAKTFTRLEYLDYKPAKLSDVIFTPDGALSFS
jgi:hypothetical protein